MLKMTFTLAAALYAGFVIWGAPETHANESSEISAPIVLAAAGSADFARPTILGVATSGQATVTRAAVTTDVVPDPATIAASAPQPVALQPRLIGEPVVVSLVSPAAAPEVAPIPEVEPELVRVTGNRVNMRSGPSTSNGVVASLPRDTLAEPIGDEINGWMQIRVVDTGQIGYMSARFLDRS